MEGKLLSGYTYVYIHIRMTIMGFRLSFPFMFCFLLLLAVPLLSPHVFVAKCRQQCEDRIR